MKKRGVTIKDIAKALNVSTSTVSRALHDHPEIKASTRQAVLDLAAQLDYQPNQVSLSLLNQRTNTIGVIVPKMGYHFFSSALEGVEEVALKAGYAVIVSQTGESYEREVRSLLDMANGRVDGLLVSLSSQTTRFDHFRQVQKRGIPLVFFDRECEEISSSKVMVDNYNAARKAVGHLLEIGCKKIAYLGGPEGLSISNKRLEGYRDVLAEHGIIPENDWIVHCDVSWQGAVEAARRLFSCAQQPDAVFAMSDRLAFAAMSVCKEKNIRIPQEVALIGFNNEPVGALTTPSLSTIHISGEEIGRKATEILLKEIKSNDELPPVEVVLEATLIERESTRRKG